MQKNNKTKGYPDQQDSPQKKNSKARIKATDKYNKANYKNLSIRVKPDQAEKIRDIAQRHHLSLAQLIIIAVTEYDTNHSDTTTTTENRTDTADTVTVSDTEENITSNGETETETETENNFDWIDDLDDSDTIPSSEMWERIAKHTEKTNKRLQEERQAERKRIKAEWDID